MLILSYHAHSVNIQTGRIYIFFLPISVKNAIIKAIKKKE